jgi:hypothetical protein
MPSPREVENVLLHHYMQHAEFDEIMNIHFDAEHAFYLYECGTHYRDLPVDLAFVSFNDIMKKRIITPHVLRTTNAIVTKNYSLLRKRARAFEFTKFNGRTRLFSTRASVLILTLFKTM